jgi:hypothetical protein
MSGVFEASDPKQKFFAHIDGAGWAHGQKPSVKKCGLDKVRRRVRRCKKGEPFDWVLNALRNTQSSMDLQIRNN